jgi:hypothetical protein
MKKYEVYKNIRKQALIIGLPISLFALMMLSVIGSLMFIIFSFSFYGIISVILINAALYVVLTQITNNPTLLSFGKVFPNNISNKKATFLNYE